MPDKEINIYNKIENIFGCTYLSEQRTVIVFCGNEERITACLESSVRCVQVL